MRARFCIASAWFLVLPAFWVCAADYPQWRGPARDGIAQETGLLTEWPSEGPKLLWRNDELGNGYSTPSVADGRIFLISDRDKKEFALALDAKDGKQLWSVELGPVGRNLGPQYPGSRSTPTVDGDRVYCLGSDGDLACLDVVSGAVRWKKNYRTDFDGKFGMWAYAESPLVDGDLVICTPGGETATLLALNKNTGDTVWKSPVPGADLASYASPIVAQVGDVKQYIQFVQKGLVGVDAKTGKFLWRDDRTKDQASNIDTPVFRDGLAFSAGSRGAGGAVQLTVDGGEVKATPVYAEVKLAGGIGGAVLIGDNLYIANKVLTCAEFATGKVLWQERGIGSASLCYADGHMYLHGHGDGAVALAEVSAAGYKEKGQFTPPVEVKKSSAWTYPVVANGRLYIREQGTLLCYDVRQKGGT